MKFTASRISEGNTIFPAEIHVEPGGLTVKIPGFFSGHIKHLDYNQLGEVSIDTPMVGYSTITFYTSGTKASAHGFTESDARKIKGLINKYQNSNNSSENNLHEDQEVSKLKEMAKYNHSIERLKEIDEYNRRANQEKGEELYDDLIKSISSTIKRHKMYYNTCKTRFNEACSLQDSYNTFIEKIDELEEIIKRTNFQIISHELWIKLDERREWNASNLKVSSKKSKPVNDNLAKIENEINSIVSDYEKIYLSQNNGYPDNLKVVIKRLMPFAGKNGNWKDFYELLDIFCSNIIHFELVFINDCFDENLVEIIATIKKIKSRAISSKRVFNMNKVPIAAYPNMNAYLQELINSLEEIVLKWQVWRTPKTNSTSNIFS